MKLSLTLIKAILILVSSVLCINCNTNNNAESSNELADTIDVDSSHYDTLTIIYKSDKTDACEQRVQQQVEEIDKRYDTILNILEKQIDSVEFRRIVNKKSLGYDKKQKKRLKDIIRNLKRQNREKARQQKEGY